MICVLSDTHDNEKALSIACEQISARKPELVIHCGDVTSPQTLQVMKDLPLAFVFGNCDWDTDGLTLQALQLGLSKPSTTFQTKIAGKSLFACHGDRAEVLHQALQSQSFDYIFHGHTHVVSEQREGKTLVLNPGALFRAKRYSYLVLDTKSWAHEVCYLSES